MRLTSTEIREAIHSGNDSEIMSYLYGHLLPKVRKHIVRNNGTQEDADDIFQDAVLRLYKSIMEGKTKEIDNVEGFLFQIAKNLWIDRVKSMARVNSITGYETEFVSEEKNAIEHILSEERSSAIGELFAMIGEKCLRIMEMHLFAKKSMDEIAHTMDLPNGDSAKAQHYRCKQKLIQLINERKDLSRTLNN